MRILVIGSVAAGTSAAAKARRNTEKAEIVIYDKDRDISYSACGLPYYIGSTIPSRDALTPRDEKWFKERYQISIHTRHEVLSIDPAKKTIKAVNLETKQPIIDHYDRLIIATGAIPKTPPIPGKNKKNVFQLRNVENADAIREYILEHQAKSAVVIGSGFIGLELLENLMSRGLKVTIIEKEDQLMPTMDGDIAKYLEHYLLSQNIDIVFNETVQEIQGNDTTLDIVTSSGKSIKADLAIFAVGVRPNVTLAQQVGIQLGETGAIRVNEKMQTNIEHIYAVGDCTEAYSILTKKPMYHPLGSTANKMGRIAGDQITGGDLTFRGILGTGIFKVLDQAIAKTGLSEREALNLGYDIETLVNIKPNHPAYYPNSSQLVIKAIADRNSRKLLGAQIIGQDGVDKRIDVLVTAMTFGAKVDDLFHLDLAYAPPFATTKDPILYTGMVLENAMVKGRKLITAQQLNQKIINKEPVIIIDARVEKQYDSDHIEGAINIPLKNIRQKAHDIDRDKPIITYCNKGVTGNAAQNILLNFGFKDVYNLSGGFKNYRTLY